MASQARFDSLYEEISQMVRRRQPDASTIMSLVGRAVVLVDDFRDVDGMGKKDLVVSAVTAVLTDVVNDKELPWELDDQMRTLLTMGIQTLPAAVDLCISVGRKVADARRARQEEAANAGYDSDVAASGCCC